MIDWWFVGTSGIWIVAAAAALSILSRDHFAVAKEGLSFWKTRPSRRSIRGYKVSALFFGVGWLLSGDVTGLRRAFWLVFATMILWSLASEQWRHRAPH